MATGDTVHHPIFARLYGLMTRLQPAGLVEHRRELLDGIGGRVIEVGAGNGANFSLYPSAVTEVVAVEPEPHLREQALEAAAGAPVAVRVLDGTADRLPAAEGSFDAAVASLVLCSVGSQERALLEMRRVLRPRGELRFYEHVLSDEPRVARQQRRVDRLWWPRVFGGCHTSRDTVRAIDAAGFTIEHERHVWVGPRFVPAGPHVIGSARAPR